MSIMRPKRAIIARGSQWVPKDLAALSLALSPSDLADLADGCTVKGEKKKKKNQVMNAKNRRTSGDE